MPQILVDGQLKEVTQAEFDAWAAANPGVGEAPAGGDVLQIPTQPKILVPNTSDTSPEQDLKKLYEEFEVAPPQGSSADYYGEELIKAEDLVTKDQNTQLYTDVDPTLPLIKDVELVQKDAAISVRTDVDPAVPLTKNIDNRVYDISTSLAPTQSNARLYGSGLTTEPPRNLRPATGDTLSGGGAAALIGAAALGTYAYKALAPSGLKDYYSAADEADRLAIGPIKTGSATVGTVDPQWVEQDGVYVLASEVNKEPAVGEEQLVELSAPDELPAEETTTLPDYVTSYNPETGKYDVVDKNTGEVAASGLSEQEATLNAQNLSAGGDYYDTGGPQLATSNFQDTTLPEYVTSYNPETGQYDIIDKNTGAVQATDLTEQQATLDAQNLNTGGDAINIQTASVAPGDINVSPGDVPVDRQGDVLVDLNTGQEYPIDPESGFVEDNGLLIAPEDIPVERQGDVLVDLNTGQEYPIDPESGFVETEGGLLVSPEDLNTGDEPDGALDLETGEYFTDQDAAMQDAAEQQAAKANAQAQAELQRQRNQASQGDWRVRLRLAPNANYLYKAPDADSGILAPIKKTDGVIFPYMPQIQTSYAATYNNYDLTHSNYRGYFYQSSHVGEINITAPFTAQDTSEAEYLLAVIHFFRTATKMFYGQDTTGRGSPPPLVFLQGLGEFQFNLHPCVISQFSYNLPNDVDYIRARSKNFDGTNMLIRRDRQTSATNPFASAIDRLRNAGLSKGGINTPPSPPTLGQQSPTYVPTKMEIQLTLLPIQSREQISKQFSMKNFANGNLLKGGFW